MKIKSITFLSILILTFSLQSFGQHLGLTFQEAEQQGLSMSFLDSKYANAVDTDDSKAVFKTEKEQENLKQAYIKLLQDFGSFLAKNNFKWEKKTKCYNRIYFSTNGTIDYFLFNFLGETKDKPLENKEKEFKQLLNTFIKTYKFSLTANTKFAQCSPATYGP